MSLYAVYQRLLQHHGPQQWWPAESPFEVMVGAILTQNAAWTNVEKAIQALKQAKVLTPELLLQQELSQLGEWIRPSGYFNLKAKRLQSYCHWYLHAGGMTALSQLPTQELRKALLSVNGIGPETADDILLYAFERPVFVIDAYTRRIFSRLQMISGEESYETLRQQFEQGLAEIEDRVAVFNQYHALIVEHAKSFCSKRPRCEGCCFFTDCSSRGKS